MGLCGDGSIEVFSDTRQKMPEIWKAHRGFVAEAVFFPDGRTLATAGLDARLKLWDLKTKQETSFGRALNAFFSVALNADASRLVAGAGEGLIRIYDPVRALQLLTLRSDTAYLGKVRFMDDGNTLVSLGYGGLQVWRAPSWAEIEAAEKADSKTP